MIPYHSYYAPHPQYDYYSYDALQSLAAERQRADYLREEQARLDEKKRLKRAANRRSASTSRVRKKQFVEEMTAANGRLEKFFHILTRVPATLTIDEHGKIRFATPGCTRLLGDEVIGRDIREFFDDSSVFDDWLKSVNEELVQSDREALLAAAVVTSSSESDDKGSQDEDDSDGPPAEKRPRSFGGLSLDKAATFTTKTGVNLHVSCGGAFPGRHRDPPPQADDLDAQITYCARELVLSLRSAPPEVSDDDDLDDTLLGMACCVKQPTVVPAPPPPVVVVVEKPPQVPPVVSSSSSNSSYPAKQQAHQTAVQVQQHNSQIRHLEHFLTNFQYFPPPPVPPVEVPKPDDPMEDVSSSKVSTMAPPPSNPPKIEELCSNKSTPSDLQNVVDGLMLIAGRS